MAQLAGGKQLAVILQSDVKLIQDHLRQNQLVVRVEFEPIISMQTQCSKHWSVLLKILFTPQQETISPPPTGLLATETGEASASQETAVIPKTDAERVSASFTPQPEDTPAPSAPKTELSLPVSSSELVQESSMVGTVAGNPPVLYQTQPVLETNEVRVEKEEDAADVNHFVHQDEPSDSSSTSLQQTPSTSSEPLEVKELLLEPDSPRDERQVAFLQKQLAGKAPTSSPRTSLWMNANTMLPSPCVLAPAANLPSISTAEKRGSSQAIPSVKQVQNHMGTFSFNRLFHQVLEPTRPIKKRLFLFDFG